ncbi:MAG: RNA polymerase sigma factor [Methylacidiphilales bacterium]|nr:RNA polymerase sigma factor [Candidatus Methylacidiphilales bacterium]
MTDAEVTACLVRGRAGDEKAILDIFHYMYPHVTRLVHANLPARESAEDLVQQVCMKVMANLHQFSGKVPFLHWVSRIAVNTCLNQIRHEKRRPELRLADLSEDEVMVVEHLATTANELDSADQVGAAELVAKLLDGLRPADRILMKLLYLEGNTIEEISSMTGWSRTMIKVRAYRARAQLRRRYLLLMKEKP